MSTDFRALCAELLQPLAEYDGANPYHEHRALITRARAALAEPEGERPSLDDVGDLCEEHCFNCDDGESAEVLHDMLTAALARWGRPAAPPWRLCWFRGNPPAD
jgi:hypothetical protein